MRDRLTARADQVVEMALCDEARLGEESAYGSLWALHIVAARRYARHLTQTFDADDLTSEAFTRVFAALRAGRGPVVGFRSYLNATMRHVAFSWARSWRESASDSLEEVACSERTENTVLRGLENGMLHRAFVSLPVAWQNILWLTIVEGYSASQSGVLLALSPNATAALALRARSGLRQAWTQVHVKTEQSTGEHRWLLERVGREKYHALSPRAQTRFDAHIRECRDCDDRVQDAVKDCTSVSYSG